MTPFPVGTRDAKWLSIFVTDVMQWKHSSTLVAFSTTLPPVRVNTDIYRGEKSKSEEVTILHFTGDGLVNFTVVKHWAPGVSLCFSC